MTGTEAVSTIFVPYGQGRGRGLDEMELGAHGVELDRLVALGLPVVPGLTVPISHAASLVRPDVARAALSLLQQLVGRELGDPAHPMLIRLLASTSIGGAGVPADLPGLGITAASAPALDQLVGSGGAIYDVFAAVIRYVGEHGAGLPGDDFADAEYDAASPSDRVRRFLALSAEAGFPFPDDPAEQLARAAEATLSRWASPRARRQRRGQGLPGDLAPALHVQAIRVGPPERCGHGVAESRDPATGCFAPTGTFRRSVRRAAADDRPGEPLASLPGGQDLLISALRTLELHMRGAAQVEFEVRDAELALLAARRIERPAPRTAIRLAVDLAEAGVIDDVTAVGSISAADIEALLHPQLQLTGTETEFARGLPAAAGAAAGRIVLSSERAVEWSEQGDPVVLVAEETTPGDLPGLLAARAVVTMRGGLAAHAAVVARGLGRPAVCGATTLRIDPAGRTVTSAGQSLAEGELISVDGSSGTVYTGAVHVVPPRPGGDLEALLRRADHLRRLAVRANADNGRDAALAIQYGAEGVGLCRTEHQFLGDRLPLVRRYLLARGRRRGGRRLGRAGRRAEGRLPRPADRDRRPAGDRAPAGRPAARVPGRVGAGGEPDAGAARRPAGGDADRAVPGAGAGAVQRLGGPGRRRRHPAARGYGAARGRGRGAGLGRNQHPPRRRRSRGEPPACACPTSSARWWRRRAPR